MAAFGTDLTKYEKGKTPELALKQAMHREQIPEDLRLAIAEKKFLTMSKFAVLGETMTDFEDKAKVIFADHLGVSAADQLINLSFLAVVWKSAKAVKEYEAVQRSRMQDDPNKSQRSRCQSTPI